LFYSMNKFIYVLLRMVTAASQRRTTGNPYVGISLARPSSGLPQLERRTISEYWSVEPN
jgi:hypothetical protein